MTRNTTKIPKLVREFLHRSYGRLGGIRSDQNPVSDEQEVIYVFAPDPYGYHNPYARTTIEDYTSVNLVLKSLVPFINWFPTIGTSF